MPDDDTTDPRYKQIAGAALQYARAELGDEIARLRKENAALKKQLAPAAAGHGPAGAADDGQGSPLRLALARARTLALFLGLLSCTTVILEGYEHTLAQHVSLSFFVPFLIGHGGNAGGMSVGSVIAQLAQGPVNRGRVAAREIVCGLGVAAQLCALAAVVLSVLGFDHGLSVVVVLSLGGLTALSAAVGAVAPLLLDAAGLDAATVAPPAVTTLIDALGIILYLSIAQAVLGDGAAAGGPRRGEL